MEKYTNGKKENLHAGHRERMRKQFLTAGFDGFSEHQIIEMLLYYTYPRCDTNETAHKLVNKFGGMAGVLDALPECLEAEKLSEKTVVLFKCLRDFYERTVNNSGEVTDIRSSYEQIKKYMRGRSDDERDNFYVVFYNNDLTVISVEKLPENAEMDTEAYVIPIVDSTVYHNSVTAVIARNYSDSMISISDNDIYFAKELSKAFKKMKLRFPDYLLIGKYSYFSVRDSYYGDFFD